LGGLIGPCSKLICVMFLPSFFVFLAYALPDMADRSICGTVLCCSMSQAERSALFHMTFLHCPKIDLWIDTK